MRARCTNPKERVYEYYGGRGISVCDRWLNSFENFFEDMGPRPSKKHSLERMDVNGNYEPGNCKWATRTEQGINRRVSSKSKSGCPGVTWRKDLKKWHVRFMNNHVGVYINLEDAIEARKQAENKYRSEALAN